MLGQFYQQTERIDSVTWLRVPPYCPTVPHPAFQQYVSLWLVALARYSDFGNMILSLATVPDNTDVEQNCSPVLLEARLDAVRTRTREPRNMSVLLGWNETRAGTRFIECQNIDDRQWLMLHNLSLKENGLERIREGIWIAFGGSQRGVQNNALEYFFFLQNPSYSSRPT